MRETETASGLRKIAVAPGVRIYDLLSYVAWRDLPFIINFSKANSGDQS